MIIRKSKGTRTNEAKAYQERDVRAGTDKKRRAEAPRDKLNATRPLPHKLKTIRRHTTMTKNELTAKVRELKELKAMQDELAAEISAIEDTIKAHMTAENTDTLTVDVFKVRWTVYTSSRIDTTALKAELPDVAARYTKTSEARRFQVA